MRLGSLRHRFDGYLFFLYLPIGNRYEPGVAILIGGYRLDQFFIFEEDTGTIITGIARGEAAAEDFLLVEGFAAGLAMVVRAVTGLDKAEAIDQGELFGS